MTRKEMFEKKERYAQSKSDRNAEVAATNGMTDGQIEALTEICRIRHEIHSCDRMRMFNDESVESSEWSGAVDKIESLIGDADLPPISWSSDYSMTPSTFDYFNILSEEEQNQWEERADQITAETGGRIRHTGLSAYIEEGEDFKAFLKDVEAFNSDVEKYLAEIDKNYGTEFCPTGWARMA